MKIFYGAAIQGAINYLTKNAAFCILNYGDPLRQVQGKQFSSWINF